MLQAIPHKSIYLRLIFLLLPVITGKVYGQNTDTAKNVLVDFNANIVSHYKTDSGEFNRFVGNAVFIQGTDTLYSDSLFENTTTKNVECFGDVRVRQSGGTQAKSDYLRYTSGKKLTYMRSNVSLTDGKNNLKCQELTYDLSTKTGIYNNGGTLTTDSTIVSSREGEYRVNDKNARFRKQVVVTDARYHIVSEDLGYYTTNKLVTFYAPSVITSDSGKSKLKTSNGTYDSRTGTAHFTGHSSVFNEDHYLEGDSIYYNKLTGYGYANGHVISIDTTHRSTLYCEHLEYFKPQRILWATGKPVLQQANKKDTFYMRADTFYSFPVLKNDTGINTAKKQMPKAIERLTTRNIPEASEFLCNAWYLGLDSSLVNENKIDDWVLPVAIADMHFYQGKKTFFSNSIAGTILPVSKNSPEIARASKKSGAKKQLPSKDIVPVNKADTTKADTTAPLIFIGYHHVRIFSDSMQGKCDSVSYSQSDSTIRMMYNPICWSHLSQITGDTILLRLDDSGKLKSMFVPNNSFVVSQSGPEKAHLFDQVQGKTLTGYFVKNTISNLIVVPDAQAIYYSKDGKGAYVGESEAKSERMKIYFEDQQINKILFEKDITQTLTPLEKVNIPEAHLSRFKWLIDKRPKSKKELFE